MKTYVVAGLVGLALSGCAVGRNADPLLLDPEDRTGGAAAQTPREKAVKRSSPPSQSPFSDDAPAEPTRQSTPVKSNEPIEPEAKPTERIETQAKPTERIEPEAKPFTNDKTPTPPSAPAEASKVVSPVDPKVKPVSADDAAKVRSKVEAEAPGAEVAAIVGDTVITLRELNNAVLARLRDMNASTSQLTHDQLNDMGRGVLDQLIDRTLVVQAARKEMKKPQQWKLLNEYTDKRWKEEEIPALVRRNKVADDMELRKKLDDRHESLEDMRQAFKSELIAREIAMLRVQPKVEKPNLPEMKAYYQKHQHNYDRPAGVRWSEVMIAYDEKGDRAAARSRAESVRARLEKGESWSAIAKAESAGATATKGGAWDWTTPGSHAVAELNKALENLPPGNLSPLIEGPSGIHIVRVESRRAAGPAPFVEVQKSIADAIFQENFKRELDVYFKKLRASTRVETPLFPEKDA